MAKTSYLSCRQPLSRARRRPYLCLRLYPYPFLLSLSDGCFPYWNFGAHPHHCRCRRREPFEAVHPRHAGRCSSPSYMPRFKQSGSTRQRKQIYALCWRSCLCQPSLCPCVCPFLPFAFPRSLFRSRGNHGCNVTIIRQDSA